MVFCTYCGKSYTREEHLSRHILIHTNVKPFECFTCHMSFSRRDILQRHYSIHGMHFGQESTRAPHGSPILRKRAPIACSNCFKAKAKCDKTFPCSRCSAKSITCTLRPHRRSKCAKIERNEMDMIEEPADSPESRTGPLEDGERECEDHERQRPEAEVDNQPAPSEETIDAAASPVPALTETDSSSPSSSTDASTPGVPDMEASASTTNNSCDQPVAYPYYNFTVPADMSDYNLGYPQPTFSPWSQSVPSYSTHELPSPQLLELFNNDVTATNPFEQVSNGSSIASSISQKFEKLRHSGYGPATIAEVHENEMEMNVPQQWIGTPVESSALQPAQTGLSTMSGYLNNPVALDTMQARDQRLHSSMNSAVDERGDASPVSRRLTLCPEQMLKQQMLSGSPQSDVAMPDGLNMLHIINQLRDMQIELQAFMLRMSAAKNGMVMQS